jgi:hypothetical protein
MKLFNLIITISDTGLPYPNREAAMEDAWELAHMIESEHMVNINDVQVDEVVDE